MPMRLAGYPSSAVTVTADNAVIVTTRLKEWVLKHKIKCYTTTSYNVQAAVGRFINNVPFSKKKSPYKVARIILLARERHGSEILNESFVKLSKSLIATSYKDVTPQGFLFV